MMLLVVLGGLLLVVLGELLQQEPQAMETKVALLG